MTSAAILVNLSLIFLLRVIHSSPIELQPDSLSIASLSSSPSVPSRGFHPTSSEQSAPTKGFLEATSIHAKGKQPTESPEASVPISPKTPSKKPAGKAPSRKPDVAPGSEEDRGIPKIGDKDCNFDSYLGRSELETELFLKVCKLVCKDATSKKCGKRRQPADRLETCEVGITLGFACTPNCCFWSRCYNLVEPKGGDTFDALFWLRAVLQHTCDRPDSKKP